jgi:chromosome segregation ATPase
MRHAIDIGRIAAIEAQKSAAWAVANELTSTVGELGREHSSLRQRIEQILLTQPRSMPEAEAKKAHLTNLQDQAEAKGNELREARAALEQANERFQAASQLFDNCRAYAGARG